MARGVPTKPDTAHLRARIAGLSRAMRNGERPPDDTELDDCRRELAAIRLTQYVEETVANWPQLPDEELVDAQEIDLARWGTQGGLLVGGYESGGDPSSANIFGPNAKRVVSTSVPAGTAVLGDFSKLRIYVRHDATLAIDASGVLFTKNQFIARCEGRYGLGILRPSAFAIVDLAA